MSLKQLKIKEKNNYKDFDTEISDLTLGLFRIYKPKFCVFFRDTAQLNTPKLSKQNTEYLLQVCLEPWGCTKTLNVGCDLPSL